MKFETALTQKNIKKNGLDIPSDGQELVHDTAVYVAFQQNKGLS